MFERAMARARHVAERRAEAKAEALAERMRAAAPKGVEIEAVAEGVRLSGRSLRARILLDPALRWLTAVLR